MQSKLNLGWNLEKKALDILGYSAPLPLAEPDRAKAVYDQTVGLKGYKKNPHIESASVRHLLSDPGLVAYVRRLCGDNHVLWRSAFFFKSIGSREIGWHHDKHFHQDGDEEIHLDDIGSHYSVLFGITPMDQTTGLIEFLPGTHLTNDAIKRDLRPRYLYLNESHIMENFSDEIMEQRRAVPIPAGSFVVFHSSILHRSLPHTGGPNRLGLAIRLVRANLKTPKTMVKPSDIISFPPEVK